MTNEISDTVNKDTESAIKSLSRSMRRMLDHVGRQRLTMPCPSVSYVQGRSQTRTALIKRGLIERRCGVQDDRFPQRAHWAFTALGYAVLDELGDLDKWVQYRYDAAPPTADLAAQSGEVHSEDEWRPYGEGQITQSQLQLLSDQIGYKAIITEDQFDDLRALVERGFVEVSVEIPESSGGVFVDEVTQLGHDYMKSWFAQYKEWGNRQ